MFLNQRISIVVFKKVNNRIVRLILVTAGKNDGKIFKTLSAYKKLVNVYSPDILDKSERINIIRCHAKFIPHN